MKVSGSPPHDSTMEQQTHPRDGRRPPAGPGGAERCAGDADFERIYQTWFHEVCRWIRARGGPESDLEDLAQEIFLVARRRLPDFDGGNLPGWLYRITAFTVSDHRRRAWFRRVVRRPRDVALEELAQPGDGPAEIAERRQAEAALQRVLARLSDRHREALVLFEIEGYSGEEIARLLEIPVATVWTRLHHARKAFLAQVERERCP